MEAYTINLDTLSNSDCITVSLNKDCIESVSLFTAQMFYGLCSNRREFYSNVSSSLDSTSYSTCLLLSNIRLSQICYEISLLYNNTLLIWSTQTGNYSFSRCMTSQLETFSSSMVTFTPDYPETLPGILSHGTTVTFSCGSCTSLKGPPQSICRDGSWSNPVQRSCGGLFNFYSQNYNYYKNIYIIIIILLHSQCLNYNYFISCIVASYIDRKRKKQILQI